MSGAGVSSNGDETAGSSTTAVLWDIDGTLLRALGTGIRAFTTALEQVTGLPFPTTSIDMGGQTDPEIAALILAAHGIDDEVVLADMLAAVEATWEALEHEFRPMTIIKPGIDDAVRRLAELDAVQTLVTGNMRSIAHRKVSAVGLQDRIDLDLGGYGSDHRLRAELVRLARARIAGRGHSIEPERTWIVGDTPRDLRCARDNGVRCVLVATGTFAFDDLRTLGAEAVFEDLSDTDAFLKVITAD